MRVETTAEYRSLRRAFELGRLRAAARATPLVLAPVALLALTISGRPALSWLPVTAALWLFAFWRGHAVLRGAFRGLVGGVVTYALPLTVLRPCCTPEAMKAAAALGADCCTMPSACLGVGALVGAIFGALVPAGASRWQTAGGIALGVASVAVLRCSTLFVGEALGLVGGIAAGVLAGAFARRLAPRAA